MTARGFEFDTGENPSAQIEVRAAWGHMLAASTNEIIVQGRGISCGARGLALIAQGLGRIPSASEVCELTGDRPESVQAWITELNATGYLYWEG